MRAFLAITCLLTGTLLAGGCATRKYVRNTTTPIQAKVDQVGEQTARNGQQIEDTRKDLKQVDEKAQNGIGAAQERATSADQHAAAADQHAATADQHAGDAMNKATQASQIGEQNSQGLSTLRNVVANLDDYKLQNSAAITFGFNKYTLTAESKEELDKVADEIKSGKRFFIAVEGYTDSTGSRAYNEALSRKRADTVVQYLVAKHDVPIYRIHMIGLGQERPLDDSHTRSARAKNRRVEVKIFSADQATAAVTGAGAGNRQ